MAAILSRPQCVNHKWHWTDQLPYLPRGCYGVTHSEIILWICQANQRQCYIITLSHWLGTFTKWSRTFLILYNCFVYWCDICWSEMWGAASQKQCILMLRLQKKNVHDFVMTWKHFPHHWPLLVLSKSLNTQLSCQWFEMPWHSLEVIVLKDNSLNQSQNWVNPSVQLFKDFNHYLMFIMFKPFCNKCLLWDVILIYRLNAL